MPIPSRPEAWVSRAERPKPAANADEEEVEAYEDPEPRPTWTPTHGTITGRVAPVPAGNVFGLTVFAGKREARVSPNGSFFLSVRAGTHAVSCGTSETKGPARAVTVAGGESVEVQIEPPPATGLVEGLVVDAKGTVAQCDCWVTSYPDHFFGNIFREPDLTRMLSESPARRQFVERPARLVEDEDCLACSYLSICHGGCPVRTHTALGTMNAKDPYCEVYKAVFARAEKFGKARRRRDAPIPA